MKKLIALSTAAAALSLAAPAQAQVLTWQCNIGGGAARLTADVHQGTGGGGGLVGGTGGLRYVPGGGSSLVYSGTLVSASDCYSFTGENEYAEFTNLTRPERFRVRFIAQGRMLLLIANPEGPGPAQYVCQQVG